MGEPLILPKFELPGDKPHWAVRAAWITGGFLLFSVIGLAVVIMHHRNLETQASLARAEAIARVKADADAKVAAIAAVAKAQKEAELAAKLAAQSIPATTVPNAGQPGDPAAPAPKVARTIHRRTHGHGVGVVGGVGGVGRNGGARAMTTASRTGSKPASNKPDAIDELLRKMK